MKVIKIILGIIIGLTVIFFATGLIIKETDYNTQIEINKPIAEVFVTFEDTDKLKEWLPEIKSIEPIDEKHGKIGSTYKMIVDNNGEDITMVEKIIAYVPNQKMTFRFNSDQMIKTDDYVFKADGNKTLVTQASKIQAKTFMTACLFPYFKSVFKNQSQEYLNRFKQVAEKVQ